MALEPHMLSHRIEAGCDEAGRGCLAGPVVAAAVILPPDIKMPKLNDSKQIPESIRDELRGAIMDQAIAWGIGICSPEEIDRMNILRASFEAMHRAIRQMDTRPEHLLIDGNRFVPFEDLEHTCVVKGDGKFMSIAAASILAKTERDGIMKAAHEQWPVYAWNRNMGYPTTAHRDAIKEHGSCSLHRKSFRLLPKQLKLDL